MQDLIIYRLSHPIPSFVNQTVYAGWGVDYLWKWAASGKYGPIIVEPVGGIDSPAN